MYKKRSKDARRVTRTATEYPQHARLGFCNEWTTGRPLKTHVTIAVGSTGASGCASA